MSLEIARVLPISVMADNCHVLRCRLLKEILKSARTRKLPSTFQHLEIVFSLRANEQGSNYGVFKYSHESSENGLLG
jgi:hypothetical protein